MDITQIYSEYKNAVYRLALAYLHSVAEAEDVTQDVFIKYIAGADKIQPGKERTWLLTVTANLSKDRLRFRKRHKEEELTELIPDGSHPDDGERASVLAEIMVLSEKERTAVYLHYYEGFSTAEIAKIQGISQTAVTTRLSRAREHLKTHLEDLV